MIKRPKREWNSFVTLCLEECLHRNDTNKTKETLYEFNYSFEEVELRLVTNDENAPEGMTLKTITVSMEEYEAGNVDDVVLVDRLFKSLS